jgi:hypothetical protein
MNALKDWMRREPLRVRAIIVAAAGLAAALGFQVDAEAIISFLVLVGVLSETARAKVTPS